MAHGKFRIDDIVLETSLEVAKQFECAICLYVAQEPVMQTPCGHIYCQTCLAPCSLCPQCREPFEVSAVKGLKEVNKMGMRMMQAIKVHCPYGRSKTMPSNCVPASANDNNVLPDGEPHGAKRPRLEEQSKVGSDVCTWQGTYGDLLAKHVCECPLHPMPCPQGCGQIIKRGDLVGHRSLCERSFEDCSICGDRVPLGGLLAHCDEKALQHVDILQAKFQASESAASEQASLSIRLARVEDQLKCRATTAHVTAVVKARAEEIKALMNSQLDKQVEWQIKDIAGLRSSVSAGDKRSSPIFSMGGIEGWVMHFFPNGRGTSNNFPYISLENNPGNISAKVKMSTSLGVTHDISTSLGLIQGHTLDEEFDYATRAAIYRLDLDGDANELTMKVELLSGVFKRKL